MSALALEVLRLTTLRRVQPGHSMVYTGAEVILLEDLEPTGWQAIDGGWEMHMATCRVTRTTIVAPLPDQRPCADCGHFLGMIRQDHRPAATYCPTCAVKRLEAEGHE